MDMIRNKWSETEKLDFCRASIVKKYNLTLYAYNYIIEYLQVFIFR